MTTGQLETYAATVFGFGHRATISAGTSTYLAGTGGTNQAAEITMVIPRDGTLTNLCWDCQTNGLTGTGNKFTVKIGAVHATPSSTAPTLTDGLVVSLDGRTNGAQPMSIPVLAGQRVGVLVQAVAGGTNISRLRVSFELEAQRVSPTWQMDGDGSTVYYDGGNVGIGTTAPGEALSVDGVIESETGGFKFPDGSMQTTAAFGGGGSSEITEAGGNVGIGIDATRNAQERLTLGPGSNIAVEMPTPQGVTAAASPAVGGLEADDYFFRVSATDGVGWTKASDQLGFDLVDPAHGIRISWNTVPGATKYRVFRALTATGAYKYVETTNAYYDYVAGSAFITAGAPPEETTAYINKLSATGSSWISGGNVGIGTTNPQAKLEVAGDIKFGSRISTPDRMYTSGGEYLFVVNRAGVFISTEEGGAGDLSVGRNCAVHGWFICLGTKSFVQAHPTDPTKDIVYTCLEGGEAGTYNRGTGELVDGVAVIDIPEHFGMVTNEEGLTVQLTPHGEWLQLYVSECSTRQIVVNEGLGKSGRFDYYIQGVRRGYEDYSVIRNKMITASNDMMQ